MVSQTSPKILNPVPSPITSAPKLSQPQNPKTNDIKSSNHSASTNSQGKLLEMATRVAIPNSTKQHTSRPTSNELITTNQVN